MRCVFGSTHVCHHVCPGSLGASATWGITISALCLLALIILAGIRYAQPRVFIKASNKTAQGEGITKFLRQNYLVDTINC